MSVETDPIVRAMTEALTAVKVEIAIQGAKLDTFLSFRQDIRREFDDHKRYVERELIKGSTEVGSLEAKVEAGFKEITNDLHDLALKDNTHDGYFMSAAFVRDLIVGIALAFIGAGVYFNP